MHKTFDEKPKSISKFIKLITANITEINSKMNEIEGKVEFSSKKEIIISKIEKMYSLFDRVYNIGDFFSNLDINRIIRGIARKVSNRSEMSYEKLSEFDKFITYIVKNMNTILEFKKVYTKMSEIRST